MVAPDPRTTAWNPGPPSARARSQAGEVTARIDGERWWATASIEVTLYRGILAVGGFDASGRGVGFALLTDLIHQPQVIGPTPANAVLTDASHTWVADAAGGGGTVTLTHFAADRAVGRFSFSAVARNSPGAIAVRQVTEGRFDVQLT